MSDPERWAKNLMRTSKAIRLLDTQCQYIGILRNRRDDRARFNTWRRETAVKLERIFGPKNKHFDTFGSIHYSCPVISVGAGRDIPEETRYWNQGLDEAQEFFRLMKDEIRSRSFFGFISLPKEGMGAIPHDKVTMRWLMTHLPISYVFTGLGAIVAIFLAGMRVGQIPIVKEILDALFKK